MKPTIAPLAAILLAAISTVPASAQTVEDRVILSIDGGFQPTKNDFSQTRTFTINVEQGTSTTTYNVPGAPLINAGVLVRVASRFGIGVAGGGSTVKSDATVNARIPHPFYFDRLREVNGTRSRLSRRETAVHLMGAFLASVGDSLLIVVSGGPSWWQVDQQLATNVQYSEQYPFDTATFTGVDVASAKERRIGFNVGVDLSYRFARHIGAGALVRFSRADVELDKGKDSATKVRAGGAQAGAGIRLLF